LLALLIGAAAPRIGHADSGDAKDMKARYERAVALYKSGQYEKAIEEFQAVYEMRPAPILLFNLAQAHRKAGHKEKALDLYERFKRENTEGDSKLTKETEQYITELRVAVEMDKAAEKEAAEKAAAEKAAAEKLAAEQAALFRKKHGPMRPLNIGKWAAAGAGVALVIIGGVLIGLDGRPVCPADMPQLPGQTLCPMELDTKNAGIGTMVVGVAALGGSAAMFVLDYKQMREAPRAPAVAWNISF
jgi:tetratricopeptide (TPR) repeat protein